MGEFVIGRLFKIRARRFGARVVRTLLKIRQTPEADGKDARGEWKERTEERARKSGYHQLSDRSADLLWFIFLLIQDDMKVSLFLKRYSFHFSVLNITFY